MAQTVAQSFEDIGIDVKLVEVEFARALDAFRDQHDAHFILPVRQTIRQINANARIYYYAGGGKTNAAGLPTGGVAYIESPLYDETYHKLLKETDPQVRHDLVQKMGDDIYETYRTIPWSTSGQRWWRTRRRWLEYKFGSPHRRLRPPGVRQARPVTVPRNAPTALGRNSQFRPKVFRNFRNRKRFLILYHVSTLTRPVDWRQTSGRSAKCYKSFAIPTER